MMKDKDLLDLLESHGIDTSKKIVSKSHKPEPYSITRFIRHYCIIQGNIKLPTYFIYYQYKKFSRMKFESKVEFFRHFSKHFAQLRDGKGRYYLLNDCFDTSPEAMEKAWKDEKNKA